MQVIGYHLIPLFVVIASSIGALVAFWYMRCWGILCCKSRPLDEDSKRAFSFAKSGSVILVFLFYNRVRTIQTPCVL